MTNVTFKHVSSSRCSESQAPAKEKMSSSNQRFYESTRCCCTGSVSIQAATMRHDNDEQHILDSFVNRSIDTQ